MRKAIQVSINGEIRRVKGPLALEGLLQEFRIYSKHIAVAVNREIIPQGRQSSKTIVDGDQIEIIRAVAGG